MLVYLAKSMQLPGTGRPREVLGDDEFAMVEQPNGDVEVLTEAGTVIVHREYILYVLRPQGQASSKASSSGPSKEKPKASASRST